MYKKILLLLHIVFAFIYIKCDNCDKLGILLYEDLGCRPKNAQEKSCPTHYECNNFAGSNETCLFREQHIPIGEKVNDSLIYLNCRVGCRCTLGANNNAKFTCAALDCPFWLGAEMYALGCYPTHGLEKCCPTGHKCPPFNDVAKCIVDGTEYKEGQNFFPQNTCLTCVCQKGFNGKFVEPFCKRATCATQIGSSEKLAQNCAPVYLGDGTLCCPSEWACPSSSDQIKQISTKSTTSNHSLSCKWGDHDLKLGEGLNKKVEHYGKIEDVTCECILPPLLTCTKQKK